MLNDNVDKSITPFVKAANKEKIKMKNGNNFLSNTQIDIIEKRDRKYIEV